MFLKKPYHILPLVFLLCAALAAVLLPFYRLNMLYAALASFVFLALLSGFYRVMRDNENELATRVLLIVLSVWTLGIAWLLYRQREDLIEGAEKKGHILNVVSFLLLFTVYLGPFIFFTVPFALLFALIRIKAEKRCRGAWISVLLNMVGCGILCSYVFSIYDVQLV